MDAVSLLLFEFRANPNQHEVGHAASIFIALRDETPRCVQLLFEHRARVDVLETYASLGAPAVHRQHVSDFPKRTTFEVAAHNIHILQMLQEATTIHH